MKKIIAVMCAGILCLSLTACGNNHVGSDAPQEQTQAQSSENTSEEASVQVDDTQRKSTEGDSEMRVARDGADMQTDDKAMPTRLPMEGGAKMLEYSKHFVYLPGPECDPMDQANACLFLASDMGKHVKGQVIQVCNGAFL